MGPRRSQPVHRVEARDRLDLGGRDAEEDADLAERVPRHGALDGLRQVQQRHHRRSAMRVRIARHDDVGILTDGPLEHGHQRSTPPRTGSSDATEATVSAPRYPSMMAGSAWRLTNDGSRILTRYGRCPPSDTIRYPSSPRGDSTALKTSPAGTS